MGIKDLSKFLKNYIEPVEIKIDDIQGKRICIDISIYLYKYKYACLNDSAILKPHIHCITMLCYKYIKNNIHPVFVFDNKSSDLKQSVIEARKNKDGLHITKEEINECIEYLKILGIEYILSNEEADSQCAYLNKIGYVDYVVSRDLDILTFGALKVLKENPNGKYVIYDLNEILEKVNITYEKFILLCIVLGCDYYKGINGIGIKKVVNYVNNFNPLNVPDIDIILKIKEYFISCPYNDVSMIVRNNVCNKHDIIKTIKDNCNYDDFFIDLFITKL